MYIVQIVYAFVMGAVVLPKKNLDFYYKMYFLKLLSVLLHLSCTTNNFNH